MDGFRLLKRFGTFLASLDLKNHYLNVVFCLCCGFFLTSTPLKADSNQNVILITIDGVRWREIFQGSDPELDPQGKSQPTVPFLLQTAKNEGFIVGNRASKQTVKIANPAFLSLPGYQAIHSGVVTTCHTNECGQVGVETLQERLEREWALPKASTEVASIASWIRLKRAVESHPGAAWTNIAFDEQDDGDDDPTVTELNRLQSQKRPPWHDSRWDLYTFERAKHFLVKHRPRYLYMMFVDTDEWGHKENYANYLWTLRRFDRWMQELFSLLDSMGEYGQNTSVIITTDHGRGDGWSWQFHGSAWPQSGFGWIFARTPWTRSHQGTSPDPKRIYSQLDIRPTLEKLLGLEPKTCEGCGKVVGEIAGDTP